ncbi:MAG: hypothetical protein D6824_07225 [Planctomycetota bacterium]|nr:MAG: hypothetical protein D6824_07225 [Planctomycetota bacterium]
MTLNDSHADRDDPRPLQSSEAPPLAGEETASEVELLLSALVDGVATPAQRARFESLATSDPRLWRLLAEAHRVERALQEGMRGIAATTAAVEAPVAQTPRRRSAGPSLARILISSLGWATAAALGLAWGFTTPPTARTPAASTVSADALLQRYAEQGRAEGRFLRELPQQLVSVKPLPDGSLDVVYMRRLLERQRVRAVYTEGVNERGETVPVPLRPASLRSKASF